LSVPYDTIASVTTALIYLAFMILVAAVVFLLASVVFGRGEELPALPPGASPTRLPSTGITAEDIRDVRFQLVLRGYKMTEVDWVLRRVGGELDELRSEVAELRERLALTEATETTETSRATEPETR
jgi:DivIVA domain-containing protein